MIAGSASISSVASTNSSASSGITALAAPAHRIEGRPVTDAIRAHAAESPVQHVRVTGGLAQPVILAIWASDNLATEAGSG